MPKIAGYFGGKPAAAAELVWLAVYQAEALRRGLIRHGLDIFQIIGGYVKSGGTHADGGAVDDAQHTPKLIVLARNMGAAKWKRYIWQGFDVDHGHLVLKGAPAAAAAKAQVRELDARGDGLVGNRPDDGPRDGVRWPLRSWKSGIKWAAAQLYAQSATKHSPRRYVVKGGKVAGRSYPGVGPLLVRRSKGFKITATATYTAPDGKKHVRTKYGTWYALAFLTAVKPTKAKPAPITGHVVKHTERPALGRRVGVFMTWNLGILNPVGKLRWLKNRKTIAAVIRANKLDVLFLQEAPAAQAKWLAEATGMRRIGGHARPIFLDKAVKVLGWSLWTPKAKAKGGKDKPVTFANVVANGTEVLLVNCHPQAEQKHTAVRGAWAEEVIDEAERRAAARGGIRIVFAGDMQGGEFARQAQSQDRPYRRTLVTAHRVVNGAIKSFNKWAKAAMKGYQMDQIVTDLIADEHRLIHNGELADHNRVRATLHLPA